MISNRCSVWSGGARRVSVWLALFTLYRVTIPVTHWFWGVGRRGEGGRADSFLQKAQHFCDSWMGVGRHKYFCGCAEFKVWGLVQTQFTAERSWSVTPNREGRGRATAKERSASLAPRQRRPECNPNAVAASSAGRWFGGYLTTQAHS